MTNLRIALFLLAVPIAGVAALAQSSGTPPEWPSPGVTQARCQYTTHDPACAHRQEPSAPVASAGQCRPPAPCPSPCCPYGYPPPPPSPWLYQRNSGDHTAAGALIGLGIGAAAGAARDGDGGTRLVSAIILGGFGAAIGSAIGHGIPARHWHRHRPDWDDPEENAMTTQPGRAPVRRPRLKTASLERASGP